MASIPDKSLWGLTSSVCGLGCLLGNFIIVGGLLFGAVFSIWLLYMIAFYICRLVLMFRKKPAEVEQPPSPLTPLPAEEREPENLLHTPHASCLVAMQDI